MVIGIVIMGFREKTDSFVLELTVFCGGALIMVYEIIGSRILAPYVGTSTYTWTSLIGVILGALSLGYWLGGSWADRNPSKAVLSGAVFLAGGLVAATVLLKEAFLPLLTDNSLPLELKTVLASLVLFAPPSVLLGFVPPYAVKLKTRSLETTGRTVGRLYALSTVGSILGTFAAGFLLLPFVGSTRTLYLIAVILFILAALIAPFPASRPRIAALAILFLGIAASETGSYFLRSVMNFHDLDTEYSRVQILDTTQIKTGRAIRAMRIDPFVFQSSIYLDTHEPASEYHRFYHLLRHFDPDFENTLMIGGAGYSFPKEYLKSYPGRRIDVVEIDPMMTQLAREHFDLKDDPRLKIIHADGRIFLNGAKSAAYDVVLIDAFSTLFSVPFHMITIEAVSEIERVLDDDGVVILNLGTAIKGDAGRFLGAVLSTYRKVFQIVLVFKVNAEKSDTSVQNVILVAVKNSDRKISRSVDEEIEILLANEYKGEFEQGEAVLTDDLAPVEYLSSFVQARFVSEAGRR